MGKSPKVAWIGPFRDGTGYAVASIHSILALDRVGVNIAPRHVKLATQEVAPPARLEELERTTSIDDVDIVVQHMLPHLFAYKAGVKNIGYFHYETTHFIPSGWQLYANTMDEIWVCSPENKEACIKSGIKVPVKVVPIPADLDQYKKPHATLPFIRGTSNRYAFYAISDWSSRKNLDGLVKAYLKEFIPADNVVLVLKTYVENHSPQQSMEIITAAIAAIKKNLRRTVLDSYPPIVLITNYLPPEAIQQIHASCDLYVCFEKGAAWCLPCFDAVGYNHPVIVNGGCGAAQFVDHGVNGIHLPYRMVPVDGMASCSYLNLYTCHEQWWEPDPEVLQMAMRQAYENRNLVPDNSMHIQKWGYDQAGVLLKEALEC